MNGSIPVVAGQKNLRRFSYAKNKVGRR